MPKKRLKPLLSAFDDAVFWAPTNVVELLDPLPAADLPKPPVVKFPSYITLPHGREKRVVTVETAIRLCNLKGKARTHYTALMRAREMAKTIEWITSQKLPAFNTNSYAEFVGEYQSFAMEILHSMVGEDKYPHIPVDIKLMLYRFRRCFPPISHEEDPLDFLSGYTEPFDRSEIYSESELNEVLYKALKVRGNLVERPRVSLKFSNKAVLGFPRTLGGFNAAVKFWSGMQGTQLIQPRELGTFFRTPQEFDFSHKVHRDHCTFIRAVNGAIKFMRRSGRLPVAFVSILEERSGKARVPTLPESHCAILSQYVSSMGKAVQERLFPMTRDSSKPRLKSVVGGIYLSGDYKSSTDFAVWEPIWVAYYHIFRQAGMEGEELDIHMEVVKYLVGPHIFFSDLGERKRYHSILKPSYVPRGDPKYYRMLGLGSWVGKYGLHGPKVGIQDQPGLRFGKIGEIEEFPAVWRVWDSLKSFLPTCRILRSIRGICMAYSLAAPALHVIGAIPHWKFRGLSFCITGDDNASAHKNIESLESLEREKLKTGMKPHDAYKSARGTRGVLIAEQVLLDVGKPYLQRVKNFPIRVLFPEDDDEWHAITMPAAAYKNLNEVRDSSTAKKILGYIYWKYKAVYDAIESLNITVFGENGLFTTFEPPRDDYYNSPGGVTADVIFKRSQSTLLEQTDKVYFTGLMAPEKLDVAHESQCGVGFKPVTDTYSSIDELIDATRAHGDISLYDGSTMGVNSPPLLDTIRSNLRSYLDEQSRKVRPQMYSRNTLLYEGPNSILGIPIDQPAPSPEEIEDEIGLSSTLTQWPFFIKGDPIDSEQVEEVLPHLCEDGKIFGYLGFLRTSFGSDLLVSINSSELYLRTSHLFVDVRNLFEKFRSYTAVAPRIQDLWYSYLQAFGAPQHSVVWFCWEVPGETRFRMIGSQRLVLACPKMVGHGGADLVFEHRLNALLKANPGAIVECRSYDKRWLKPGVVNIR